MIAFMTEGNRLKTATESNISHNVRHKWFLRDPGNKQESQRQTGLAA
jgi:hypothetical protein